MRKVAFEISDNSIQASSSYAGPSVVDYEGFQPVVNRKKKHAFFRQTLSIQKINEFYEQKEQELMEMLSGML